MGRDFSVNTDELELPETVFVRDIDDRVFQAIVLQSLSRIPGIELSEGNFLDHWLGRTSGERLKGIAVSQNEKTNAVSIRVEVNIGYDLSIPQKAEEIQLRLSEDIARMTGLHVARVHVVFKGMVVERGQEEEVKAEELVGSQG